MLDGKTEPLILRSHAHAVGRHSGCDEGQFLCKAHKTHSGKHTANSRHRMITPVVLHREVQHIKGTNTTGLAKVGFNASESLLPRNLRHCSGSLEFALRTLSGTGDSHTLKNTTHLISEQGMPAHCLL